MRGKMTIRGLLLCGLIGLELGSLGCASFRAGNGWLGKAGAGDWAQAKQLRDDESLPELNNIDIVSSEGPVVTNAIPDAVKLTELLERAAEEPRRAEWQVELARYWLQAGQSQEAESYAVRALGLDQHCAEAWLIRAEVALGKSEWAVALGCYQQAINSRGEDVETLGRIAVCYQQLGQPRRALSACERAIELSPGGKPGHQLVVQHGRVLAELGQSRRAMAILEEAVTQPEATASSWLALSEAQALAGETSAARATVAQAQELFPEEARLRGWQQAQVPAAAPLTVWK